MSETEQHLRMLEALLFAAEEPLDEATIRARLPEGADVPALLAALGEHYRERGVNLVRVAEKWQLRTAPELRYLLEEHKQQPRRLSRAALETLAIIAYHQPITRAEIEEVRGVGLSKGTLDMLLEIGWVRPRGRRRVPGRPVTYGTGDAFLEHFGLEDLKALPGLDELKAAGLLQGEPPPLRLATNTEQVDEADDGGDEPTQGTLIGLDGGDPTDERPPLK